MELRYILKVIAFQQPAPLRPAHDAIAPGSILTFNIVFFFFPCLEKHPVSGDVNVSSEHIFPSLLAFQYIEFAPI